MKVEPPNIRVFVRSESEGNPYERDERASLNTGLYCETVMKTRQLLLVPDALADQEWNANPDIKLGMISYMGVPVAWPNGDIFGTICVLDARRNEYSELYRKFLFQCREVLQADLKSLQASAELELKVLERTAELRRSGDSFTNSDRARACNARDHFGRADSLDRARSEPTARRHGHQRQAGLRFLSTAKIPTWAKRAMPCGRIIMDGNRADDVIRRVRALAKRTTSRRCPSISMM